MVYGVAGLGSQLSTVLAWRGKATNKLASFAGKQSPPLFDGDK